MGELSKIEWTDHTFNPWWGCEKVSPACAHCYAEAWAKRFGTEWGGEAERRFFGDEHWKEPENWNRKAEYLSHPSETPGSPLNDGCLSRRPPRVFCGSMCDVFEERPDLADPRDRLWRLIVDTPHLIWLLLTKRPKNVVRFGPLSWVQRHGRHWPPNVWIGTTVEDQKRADERIPHLLQIPAPVRFLSCEPLLSDLRLGWCESCGEMVDAAHISRGGHETVKTREGPDGLPEPCQELCGPVRLPDWCIAGGESGPKARPSHPDWFRSLRDQCQAAGVPFFFKQWGEWAPAEGHEGGQAHPWNEGPTKPGQAMTRLGKEAAGRLLDGLEWSEVPG